MVVPAATTTREVGPKAAGERTGGEKAQQKLAGVWWWWWWEEERRRRGGDVVVWCQWRHHKKDKPEGSEQHGNKSWRPASVMAEGRCCDRAQAASQKAGKGAGESLKIGKASLKLS